jgi:hypothetical protein
MTLKFCIISQAF